VGQGVRRQSFERLYINISAPHRSHRRFVIDKSNERRTARPVPHLGHRYFRIGEPDEPENVMVAHDSNYQCVILNEPDEAARAVVERHSNHRSIPFLPRTIGWFLHAPVEGLSESGSWPPASRSAPSKFRLRGSFGTSATPWCWQRLSVPTADMSHSIRGKGSQCW